MPSSLKDFIQLVENAGRADPLGLVADIRAHDNIFNAELGHGEASHFHLHPCGRCHAPTWQQPCPVCNYYPMGDQDHDCRIPVRPGSERSVPVGSPEWNAWAEEHFRTKAFDTFKKSIEHAGNFGVWYFMDKKRRTAYKEDSTYKRVTDEMIERMRRHNFPSAEEIWAAYGPTAK